jgi:O-methyltransferase
MPVARGPGLSDVYDMFPEIERHRQRGSFVDLLDEEFWHVVDRARPYTMLTIEALHEIHQAIRYLARSGVPGDLVECGVFMGGGVFAAAEWASAAGLASRRFFLYDTFCGFPDGTAPETDFQGNVLKMYPHPHFRQIAEDVVGRCAWPRDRFVFVEGDVARTLPETRPSRIALLRLDTDDYASTRVELELLYPLLSPGGVIMIDDYGHFRGSRRATDEFLAGLDPQPLLHRVSYAVRSGVKPAGPAGYSRP